MRSNATLHLPETQERLKEATEVPAAPLPRKVASKAGPIVVPQQQQNPVQEEVSATRSGSRHPQGHKVKSVEEIYESVHKSDYWSVADGINVDCVWYQPKKLLSSEKNFVECEVDVLLAGQVMISDVQHLTFYGLDLLKMMYLAEKADNTFVCSETEPFETWRAVKHEEMNQEQGHADIEDSGAMAIWLMNKNPDRFILAKGSWFECYFQKRCIREFTGSVKPVKSECAEEGKAIGRSKFEYFIDMRIFIMNSEIHQRKLSEIFPATQPC